MPVTTPITKLRETLMPQPTPHGHDCRTCPVSLLSIVTPILGTVRAGEPTVTYHTEDDPPTRGFVGIYLPVEDTRLSGAGVASGDTLMISTRYSDIANPELYAGEVVLASDPQGNHYLGVYDAGALRDDRGVITSDALEVIGVTVFNIRRMRP